MPNQMFTRKTVTVDLSEFGVNVPYVVEYLIHEIGAIAINRIWPVHAPMVKRGGHDLTWDQRGNIGHIVFNHIKPREIVK